MQKDKEQIEENKGNILIYQTEDGVTKIEVAFDGDTIWASIDKIAELYQKHRVTILEHINNIYEDGELERNPTCRNFLQVQIEGKREVKREIEFYNLQLILAVGYRVKSHRGVQFRKWASEILQEYMKKGFVMNDELLKNAGGGIYFKELLERIRDIRSSEKVFYRQVLDLFATSIDYDSKSKIAVDFLKEMQNKLLYSVSGKTAAELISGRANANLPFMGLTAFKGLRPQKNEVIVSKNYLNNDEIAELNLMVSAYLDIAELNARRRKTMHMKDWVKELDKFITYQERKLLSNGGKVSHEKAITFAESEYDKYNKKNKDELTQVEKDFLNTINETYKLLEGKKKNNK
jgi:hypothetical protein